MKFFLQWIFLFFLCVFVRLPYFFGNHLYFDGDEAIIGIMAQDLLGGENVPVYFYGQHYGLSFFEVLSTAFFQLFFGDGVYALKLGALLIFSLGLTFIYRGLKNYPLRGSLVWLLIFLAAIFPIWFLWAAKVRGGYVTSFAAMAALFWFTSRKETSIKNNILSGICISIAALSHVLMLVPFLGLLFYFLSKKFNRKNWAILIVSVVISIVLLKIPSFANEELWAISPKLNLDYITLKASLKQFPQVFMGYFYYDYIYPFSWKIKTFFFIQFIFFVYLFYKRLREGSNTDRLTVIFLSTGILLSFFVALLLDEKAYRYLIGPITAFGFLYFYLFYAWLSENNFRFFKSVFFLLIFLVPIFAFSRIPAFWQSPKSNDMAELKKLNHILMEKNITGIFCTDALLAWQINYYGKDKYAARYFFEKDRTQKYIDKVNSCYSSDNCNSAIVGIYGSALGMDTVAGWHESVIYVDERFYIQPIVKQEFLEQAAFELP